MHIMNMKKKIEIELNFIISCRLKNRYTHMIYWVIKYFYSFWFTDYMRKETKGNNNNKN